MSQQGPDFSKVTGEQVRLLRDWAERLGSKDLRAHLWDEFYKWVIEHGVDLHLVEEMVLLVVSDVHLPFQVQELWDESDQCKSTLEPFLRHCTDVTIWVDSEEKDFSWLQYVSKCKAVYFEATFTTEEEVTWLDVPILSQLIRRCPVENFMLTGGQFSEREHLNFLVALQGIAWKRFTLTGVICDYPALLSNFDASCLESLVLHCDTLQVPAADIAMILSKSCGVLSNLYLCRVGDYDEFILSQVSQSMLCGCLSIIEIDGGFHSRSLVMSALGVSGLKLSYQVTDEFFMPRDLHYFYRSIVSMIEAGMAKADSVVFEFSDCPGVESQCESLNGYTVDFSASHLSITRDGG